MIPTEIILEQAENRLVIRFEHNPDFVYSAEYLRVYSPSAEVRGHGVGHAILQRHKDKVRIESIEAVGYYALKIIFNDGHDSGLYTWDYLYDLGLNQAQHWADYQARVAAADQ